MFGDRRDAGRRLARELAGRGFEQPVVLAVARGGVPVAAEVAGALSAPLDVLVVRKVAAPGNADLAVAAIVDGDPPEVVLNREIIEAYALDDDELQHLVALARPELERLRKPYRARRAPLSVRDRTAILVDDGIVSGTTAKLALRALRRRSPRKLVLAVPVAPPEALDQLGIEADEIVCLSRPGDFATLGRHYAAFPDLSDEEVIAMWRAANKARVLAEKTTAHRARKL